MQVTLIGTYALLIKIILKKRMIEMIFLKNYFKKFGKLIDLKFSTSGTRKATICPCMIFNKSWFCLLFQDGYFEGELTDGRHGLVPSNFVEKVPGKNTLIIIVLIVSLTHMLHYSDILLDNIL